jgi:PAS domain S-box-containing protein
MGEHGRGSEAELRDVIARLEAQLAEAEQRHLALREDLAIRTETLAAHGREVEHMLEWYADLFEHAPIAYLALTTSGLVRDINLTGAALLGVERAQMIDRPLRLHVAAHDRRRFLDHMLVCRQTDGQFTTELSLIVAGGRQAPVQLISRRAAVSAADGLIFRTAIFDLSELREAEAAVRREHQRLTLALAAGGAGLYEYVWPHMQLSPSDRWIELVGGGPGGAVPAEGWWRWFASRIEPDGARMRERELATFLGGGSLHYTVELAFRRMDGARVWLREFAQAGERDLSGQARRVVGLLLDITEDRRRLVEAQEQSQQLRALSTALFRVEENERRELAALLHDDLGQRLVAAKLKLGELLKENDSPRVAEIVEMLDQTHQAVRSLTFQLSPPILQDLGLIAGLRWLAREMQKQFGLDVSVEADEPLPMLSGEPNYLLFRCVRELLFNVVKHAKAQVARIEVRSEPGSLAIAVEDPGVGFDPAQVAADRHERHSFGLLSVRERVEGLGGRVVVDAEAGRGTRVELRVPLA